MKRVVVALILLLAACNPQPRHLAATPSPSPSELPPIEITGHGNRTQPVHFIEQSARTGRKIYELLARSYVSHSARDITQTTFAHATVLFYDKDGTTLRAQAPVAALDDRSKQVILSGGVHATTSTGLALTCKRLVYDRTTALLHGTGNVRVAGMQGGQQQTLTGSTFTSNVRLTQMVMK